MTREESSESAVGGTSGGPFGEGCWAFALEEKGALVVDCSPRNSSTAARTLQARLLVPDVPPAQSRPELSAIEIASFALMAAHMLDQL
jgi:hypothetical protein